MKARSLKEWQLLKKKRDKRAADEYAKERKKSVLKKRKMIKSDDPLKYEWKVVKQTLLTGEEEFWVYEITYTVY